MRLAIRGCTGSGKTTLSRQVGERLEIPAYDMDDFFWLPGWKSRSREEMRADLAKVLAGETWAIAGNYSYCDEVVLPRLTHLVWLDYSRAFTFRRLLRRTAIRVATRESICNGNREQFLKSIGRNGILWWHIISFARMRERAELFFADPNYDHLQRRRFRKPEETEAWLQSLRA